MNILLPLIQNVALLSLAALVYIAVPRNEDGWSRVARSVAIGLGLGGASAVVMLIPIEIRPGLIIDARGAPMLISGILGGPITALVAAVPAVAMRVSIGGIGMVPGVIGIVLYALFSVAAWAYLRRRGMRWRFAMLLVYAGVSSCLAIPSILLLPDIDMALAVIPKIGPAIVAGNIAGTAVLGLLLSIERRRRDMITSLRESEAAAQRALEVRTRFIAMMSHELRTPLNAVLGYAQLLNDDALTPRQGERLGRLSRSATTLLRLIDDILQFSRFQTGTVTVVAGAVALPDAIGGALDLVRRDAADKGLTLAVDESAIPRLELSVDGARLQQVLANVLSNAIKFTPNGTVSLEATVDDSAEPATLRITVSDTGIGIAEGQIERIFQPFERLGATAAPGTGLGLSIVHAIVEAMDGTVGIESAPEAGTRVTIQVPVGVIGAIADTPAPAPVGASGIAPGEQERRILVVDDIELNTDVLGAFLSQAGCTVETAVNGADAVESARKGRFDAILMDVEMPVMDGLTATRTLRGADMPDQVRTVPIIAVTAYASHVDMQACLDAGMNGYLSKPVSREALFAALARHGVLTAPDQAPAPATAPQSPTTAPPDNDAPPFSEERFASLQALIPAATLQQVLGETATQIESLGAQILAATVENDDKRQALHKLVSIAGNVGLLRLSTLSRRYQDAIKAGQSLDDHQISQFAGVVDVALAQVAKLRAAGTAST